MDVVDIFITKIILITCMILFALIIIGFVILLIFEQGHLKQPNRPGMYTWTGKRWHLIKDNSWHPDEPIDYGVNPQMSNNNFGSLYYFLGEDASVHTYQFANRRKVMVIDGEFTRI